MIYSLASGFGNPFKMSALLYLRPPCPVDILLTVDAPMRLIVTPFLPVSTPSAPCLCIRRDFRLFGLSGLADLDIFQCLPTLSLLPAFLSLSWTCELLCVCLLCPCSVLFVHVHPVLFSFVCAPLRSCLRHLSCSPRAFRAVSFNVAAFSPTVRTLLSKPSICSCNDARHALVLRFRSSLSLFLHLSVLPFFVSGVPAFFPSALCAACSLPLVGICFLPWFRCPSSSSVGGFPPPPPSSFAAHFKILWPLSLAKGLPAFSHLLEPIV